MTLVAGHPALLAYLTVPGGPSSPEMVQLGADAGFDGVSVRVVPLGAVRPSGELVRETARVRETLERINATGVPVVDIEYIRLDPDTTINDMLPILEAGALLGATRVTVMAADPDEGRTAERYAALCDAATPYGLRPMIEFTAYTAVTSLKQAHRIVTRAGHPAGAIAVDTYHLARTGGTADEVAALAAVHPEMFPVGHVADAIAGAPPRGTELLADESTHDRLLPGAGDLPIGDVVDALPPGVALSLEAPVRALADQPPCDVVEYAAAALRAALAAPQ